MQVHALTEQERFIREFLAIYKEQTVLWDKNHQHYNVRSERCEAIEVLLKKTREYYPDADEDFVRTKIVSMRACFRKEYKKVLDSKLKNASDVYQPSLWYYNLLLFVVGEEPEQDLEMSSEINTDGVSLIKIPFWSRDFSAALIDLLKNHPCLYRICHPDYGVKIKRYEAFKTITTKLIKDTGKLFEIGDVRRKIQLLKGQYRVEHKKIQESKRSPDGIADYTPSLWCYELLGFLEGNVHVPKTRKERFVQNRNKSNKRDSSDYSGDEDILEDMLNITDVKKEESETSFNVDEKEEFDNDGSHDSTDKLANDKDIYDTIGRNVAYKLREMTEEQRKIAARLTNELMYHGQMENLTANSRLVLDTTM